ncbi:MAG: thioredoxin 2 [Methanoregulaceae archaeon PtaU1.Bin222]|nr:MAG: thioredoxin 2 [Methanoregulaceae archaeon PtaU1.Bin222]
MGDEELQRIREKKLRELEEKLHAPRKDAPAAKVILVDQANFRRLLGEHQYFVVDFWAEWCGPCRMVGPVIEDLCHEMAGQVTFGKCNTDHNQQLAVQFNISAIPTILLFRGGQLADRITGAYPKDAIRSRIVRSFGLSS